MRPLLALGTPLNIATYLRRTSLDANWSQRELCAAASLATTITPLVPLSNLCTIPGRIIDPRASESDDTSSSSSFSSSSSSSAIERLPVGTTSSGNSQCPNPAFTNVPLACPALGCVTIPAGLFTTNTLESSYKMSNSIQGSGIASLAVSGSNSPATTSPGFNALDGLDAVFPLSVTIPALIAAATRARDADASSTFAATYASSLDGSTAGESRATRNSKRTPPPPPSLAASTIVDRARFLARRPAKTRASRR